MALHEIFYVLIILVCICNCGIIALSEGDLQLDIELEHRLKLLNKPAIKTVQLDSGIFDCVDIYKQLAFDHPLLKNHKIQMKPSHSPDRSDIERGPLGHSDESSLSIDCPIGSVPIRRTTREDLIREKTLGHVQAYHPNAGGDDPNAYFAIMEVNPNRDYQVTGAKADIGIFNPQLIDQAEASGAHVWITEASGDGNVVDAISAGWMVDPILYKNNATYFTASWRGKNNSYGSGCADLRCPGFVQVDSYIPLGSVMHNISNNNTLYRRLIWIYQDNVTKNWWLVAGKQETPVGYWPKELFSFLEDGAKTLLYGGVVRAIPDQLMSPPMGSGIYEKCRDDNDGFFAKVSYQTTDEVLRGIYIPPRRYETANFRSDCPNYGVNFMCRQRKEWDVYFLYGGPRGKCVNTLK